MASKSGAIVIDATVFVATASKEALRDVTASAELAKYASQGYDWYAPGVAVAETLFALCNKESAGVLTASEHAAAVQIFQQVVTRVLPPPRGDTALIDRAEQIRAGYGCSRSADAIYIALAEELTRSRPTVLLTFDQGLPNQAAKHAPTVVVQLL